MFTKRSLYHMTPIENVPSIFRFGVLSRNLLSCLAHIGVKPRSIDNPDVNSRRSYIEIDGRSLHDFVPMYWTTHTPMQYHITQSHKVIDEDDLAFVVIEKKPLLLKAGVFTTSGNAARNDTRFYPGWDGELILDESVMESRRCYKTGRFRMKSAEVLYPDRLCPEYIQYVAVRNQRTREKLQRMIAGSKQCSYVQNLDEAVRVQSCFYIR